VGRDVQTGGADEQFGQTAAAARAQDQELGVPAERDQRDAGGLAGQGGGDLQPAMAAGGPGGELAERPLVRAPDRLRGRASSVAQSTAALLVSGSSTPTTTGCGMA